MIDKSAPKLLTENQLKSIERRKKLALLLRAKDKIEDYQTEVFSIIENDGLKSIDANIRLKTSKDVLEFIVPKKKSSEISVITRKLEDIISESIQEAEVVPDENNENSEKTPLSVNDSAKTGNK